MSLKDECHKIIEIGYPVATLAKRIGRDNSTLYKWLKSERNLSAEVESEMREELKRIQQIWVNCDFNN